MQASVITGTGCYIPPYVRSNRDFEQHLFHTEEGQLMEASPGVIVKKFKQITGIEERRYTTDDLTASDIGSMAAAIAVEDSGIDPEEIDQLIVAHNFGNVKKNTIQTDAVPSLASQIKHNLGIRNPSCVAYDVLFGCPGWVQAVIHADAFFKAGLARKALVIGTETLSRVIDVHDRDCMIFADGAGAAVIEYQPVGDGGPGLLSAVAQTFAFEQIDFINMGMSYYPDSDPSVRFIKMKGRKVYEFAMTYVPAAMKVCVEKAGIDIRAVKKIFIHQANEKMDDGIISRLYQLYGVEPPPGIMPMSIQWLGNSSVATVPTLYDLVRRNKIEGHSVSPGDIVMFASVGAGMNINAACYRC